MSLEEQADLLSRLTQVVAAASPVVPLTERLCLAMTEIAGLDGGSMAIGYSSPTRTVLCTTDVIAERIEELQDLSREGPGLDAHRLGRVVGVRGPQIAERWPMFVQTLGGSPDLTHLLAAPMRPENDVLGVLTMYGTRSNEVAVSEDQVQFLANAIGIAVLGGFDRNEDVEDLWSTRDLVNQATGMVVAQLRISPADALALLRAHAFAHANSLASIASEVVARDLSFTVLPCDGPDQDGDPR